jgi:hypothetical protein
MGNGDPGLGGHREGVVRLHLSATLLSQQLRGREFMDQLLLFTLETPTAAAAVSSSPGDTVSAPCRGSRPHPAALDRLRQ